MVSAPVRTLTKRRQDRESGQVESYSKNECLPLRYPTAGYRATVGPLHSLVDVHFPDCD